MILKLKITCPHCGAQFKMGEATDNEIVHDIAELAAAFGRGWPAVELYLRSFQRGVERPLNPVQLRLLLGEIARFWHDERFAFNRKDYHVSRAILGAAMRHVGLLNKTAFTNHNYLKKVAIDFQQKANRQKAREEREHESSLRERAERDPEGPQKIGEIIEGLKQ